MHKRILSNKTFSFATFLIFHQFFQLFNSFQTDYDTTIIFLSFNISTAILAGASGV